MGFFDNAQEIGPEHVPEAVTEQFVHGEEIQAAFSMVRDQIVFTNRRIIFMDVQGLTGRKQSFWSVPYSSINSYSIETAGFFDADADLKIWVKGDSEPITQDLAKNIDTAKVSRLIGRGIL